jgi:hypothetical protein
VTRLNWKHVLIHLEIVLILTQDWSMVCSECTTGLEIVLDTPDGTPIRHGSSGISFRSIWMQDRCMVCTNVPEAQKSFWTHPMVLCYVAQLEDHFGPFRDSANLDVRTMHSLYQTYHRLENHFGRT